MAAASDVLDVWNAIYRDTVAGKTKIMSDTEQTEDLEGLNHLSATQERYTVDLIPFFWLSDLLGDWHLSGPFCLFFVGPGWISSLI